MQIPAKVFVVTGGGNGIGREVALQLLGRGAKVAAVDLSEEGLATTREAAASYGDRLSTHTLSVADRAAVDTLPDAVVAAHGHVDGVLNIAGIIQRFVHVEDLSFEEIERVMNVNFYGTLNMDKVFLPLLKQRPEAVLLNVSSMGGLVPVPGQGAYGASKAAMNSMSQSLAVALAPHNIFVGVVAPGFVETERVAHKLSAEIRNQSPLGRVALPEEVARTVVFLAQPGTEFLTGCIVDVNGASYLRS